MREKPPVDLKRCRGNARETAAQREATLRVCAGRPDVYEKPPLDLKRCRGNARKAATCLWVLSFWCHAVDAHRSLRRLLARYAVPWRVRNHDAVVACEITTHSPWCRRMKKGARANMTRTPIKTRCSVALHCGPRLKQDETLGERHSPPAFMRPLRTASCTARHKSRRERGAPRGCLPPRYRRRAGRG